jgi:hypothetical protein
LLFISPRILYPGVIDGAEAGTKHFLVLETRGVEWVPLEWYSLKSFVNGKKTYFEGMAPKE